MSIKRLEFTYKKPKTRYDPDLKKHVGYQIDVHYGGTRRRDTFATQKEAENFVDALKERNKYERAGLRAPVRGHVRLTGLFAARMEQIDNKRERVRAKRIFKTFSEIIGADLKVDAVRAAHFQHFINARKKTVKPETVNRELTLLSSAFSHAAEMFPDELEGFTPVKIPRPRFKSERRERVITEKENDRILAAILTRTGENEKQWLNRQRIARMWKMGWYLGLRYAEIEKMQKPAYDGETLRVMRFKTGTTATFEHLPQEVHDLLREAIDASGTDHIFTLAGSPPSDFYTILKAAATQAGLQWGSGKDAIVFHSLRHSFVTRLIQVTDLATTASFSGHSDREMVALYSHASKASRRAAMDALYGKTTRDNSDKIYDAIQAGTMTKDELFDLLKK